MDGKVDVAPIEVGLTHQRHQFLDFTNIVNFGEIHIVSKKNLATLNSDFLTGIFDKATMTCIIFSFVLLTFLIWLSDAGGKFDGKFEATVRPRNSRLIVARHKTVN